MQTTQQPKRYGFTRRIVFVAGQDAREDTAGFDVGGHQPEQLVVHRGARRAAEPPLRPQGVQQVFGAAHR